MYHFPFHSEIISQIANRPQMNTVVEDLHRRNNTFKQFMEHRINEVTDYDIKTRMSETP